MQTHLACASCIIDDLRGALEMTVPNEPERLAILREAMAWLGQEFDQRHIPSFYITRIHRLLKQRTGLEMPFHTLRQQCNRAGLAVRQQIAQALTHIEDDLERLRWLVSWAIAGNHLDFRTVGTGYDLAADEITAQLATVMAEGLAIDHTPALLPLLYKNCRVLYLADNVGEIALDTLLVAELQRYGCQVVVAVKGGPITSDAVWEDAQSVGMDKLAPVILTGPDTLGLPLDEMSTDLHRELERAQVIISKGQANYYACSELVQEYPGAFFCLLRTKCFVAAQSLGLDKTQANVAVLLPQRSG
ncbi:MAG: ARMT1-like domain-containing protein [Candidatus Hadarchaeum sp.]